MTYNYSSTLFGDSTILTGAQGGGKTYGYVEEDNTPIIVDRGINSTVVFHDLRRDGTNDVRNVDLEFYGGGGNTTIEYGAAAEAVTLTGLSDGSGFDFHLSGGQGAGSFGSNPLFNGKLNSFEVWTRGVETFRLTELADTVNLAGSTATGTTVYTQGGNDRLTGSAQSDVFDAGNGNDVIEGGGGNDILTGGTGADTFIFNGDDGHDVITDLRTNDMIYLRGATPNDYSVSFTDGVTTIIFGATTIELAGIGQLLESDFTDMGIGVATVLHWTGNASGLTDLEAAQYIASYPDLIAAFGTNLEAGKSHYANNGIAEGREITFNSEQYLANYGDLQNAFGDNLLAATQHFITHGIHEGRIDNMNITDELWRASVSSQWDGNHGVDKVLDGNTNTFNHTAAGDDAASMTFQFGQDFALDEINIVNRHDGNIWNQIIVGNRLTGASVEAYNDGTVVWSGTLNAATHQDLHLGGVVADTVVINAAGNNYLHIAEVDIWGDHVF